MELKLTYKYEVVDTAGRLWAKTLTRIRAVKLVKELKATKNLDCVIHEVGQ